MPATLKQSAARTIAKGETQTCRAVFDQPTIPGSLIVVTCVAAGALPVGLVGPAGFTIVRVRGLRDIEVGMWYLQDAPATTSVTVGYLGRTQRSLQVRALEYRGAAQSNALDKVVVATGESDRPFSGTTSTTAQADELVIGVIGSQYGSTTQFGFAGALASLFESVSPRSWLRGSNEDWERGRMSVHQAIATVAGVFSLASRLSSARRWVAILATFRGGTTGPARMTSTMAGPMLSTGGGSAVLTAFGPLTSRDAAPMLTTEGGGGAIMHPFDYQFRLNGLLIGQDTPYRVVSHDGLYGHDVRTSDEDQPRGDGSLRGVDLQSARQVLFKLQVAGTRNDIEVRLAELYASLVPQRDTDWSMVWRHPGQEARMIRCRPIQLPREADQRQSIIADQAIALRCADPRHYSAVTRRVTVPVTPAGQTDVTVTAGVNLGNAPAYPLIRVTGPPSGAPVTRIELVNVTGDVTFDVAVTLPPKAVLIGDMEARTTGAPRSVITLDGQPKYGSWQQPREAFFLAPAPLATAGSNLLYLRTTPAGAAVTCVLEYRDCWSG